MSDKVEHEYACMVCGAKLVYDKDTLEHLCMYCGEENASPIYCPNGHFICDTCHSRDAIAFLEMLAERDDLRNTRDIIELAYSHSSFKFHGPEHHSLVPAAILIALKNRDLKKPSGASVSLDDVLEGIRRGSKIPGGFCGYAGTCGGCVGAGVAIALFLESTPKKAQERETAHLATARAMGMVQDGLVRCCKRSTFYGVTAAIETLAQYDIDIGPVPPEKSCKHWERNRDCGKEKCMYFPS